MKNKISDKRTSFTTLTCLHFQICIVISAFFLGGCVGSQTFYQNLERDGSVIVESSNESGYDFKVAIKNVVGVGFSGDNLSDRELIIRKRFADKCFPPEILEEKKYKTGTYLTGAPTNFYVSKVRCHERKETPSQ